MSCLYKYLLCFLLLVSNACAENRVLKVVTDSWVNSANKDGTGYFFDILHAIYAPLNIQLQIQYAPFSRSLVLLSQGEADVVLGVYKGEYDNSWYAKYPVGMDIVDIAISTEMNQIWQGRQTLRGKKIIAPFGYLAEDFFSLEADYSEVRNANSMVKMLAAGRVDGIIGYKKDFIPIWQSLGLDRAMIIKEGMFEIPIYFVFYDSPSANNYKEIFNQDMKRLYKSGELKAMLTDEIGNMKYFDGYGAIQ